MASTWRCSIDSEEFRSRLKSYDFFWMWQDFVKPHIRKLPSQRQIWFTNSALQFFSESCSQGLRLLHSQSAILIPMSAFLAQVPPVEASSWGSQLRHFSLPWHSTFPILALPLLPTFCPGVQKEAGASCLLFIDSKMIPTICAAPPDPHPMPFHGENGTLRSPCLSYCLLLALLSNWRLDCNSEFGSLF